VEVEVMSDGLIKLFPVLGRSGDPTNNLG